MRLNARYRFSLALAIGLMSAQARAQTILYYNANGAAAGYGTTAGGATSWDGNVWSTSSTATVSASTWVQGDAAQFLATSHPYYIMTVDMDETIASLNNAQVTQTGSIAVISQLSQLTTGDSANGSLDLAGATSISTGTTAAYATVSIYISAPINDTAATAVGARGSISEHGYGTLYLYGLNTYSGGTTTTGGQTLEYNNSMSFGTGTLTINSGGQAIVNGGTAQPVVQTGTYAMPNTDGVANPVIANNIVFGTANSNVNLVGGAPTGSNAYGTNFTGSVTLPGSGTYTLNTSNTATTVDQFSGSIIGSSNLTVQDVGTLILAGNNSTTFTGTMTISGTATVLVATGGTLGSGGVTDNSILSFNQTGANTVGNLIGGSGVVNFMGAGTTILNNVNTYSGATNINAGNLVANSNGATGTGTVQVNSGGTLSAGTAAIMSSSGTAETGGAVGSASLNTGGSIRPTNTAAGDTSATTLKFSSSLTLNGGTFGTSTVGWMLGSDFVDATAATFNSSVASTTFNFSGDVPGTFNLIYFNTTGGGFSGGLTSANANTYFAPSGATGTFQVGTDTSGDNILQFIDTGSSSTPEPGSLALLAAGGVTAMLAAVRLRRRKG